MEPYPIPMRSGILSLAGFGCAAFAAGLGFLSAPAELAASGSNLTALADADGDLLDDALELRLGTDPNFADPDGDGRTDFEEFILGSDPNTFESAQNLPNGASAFEFEVYQVGSDFVFEFFALTSLAVYGLEFHMATEYADRTFDFSELQPFLVDNIQVASSLSGFQSQRLRLRIDSAWFDHNPSAAFGAICWVDNEVLADSVQLTHSGGYLAEIDLRLNQSSTRGSGPANSGIQFNELAGGSNASGGNGQKTGGLFPVEPGDGGGTSTGTADEICIQTLVPIANLGGGRVKYVVADAACDPEPGSICMPGCALTKDDTVIGIDVVGLLGG